LKRISTAILFFSLFFSLSCFSQSSDNPFELQPRLKKEEEKKEEVKAPEQQKPENPFDLVAPTQSQAKKSLKKAKPEPEQAPAMAEDIKYESFKFWGIIFSLVLFTAFLTFFRNTFKKVYRAILNDNLLKQAFRDRTGGKLIPFFILYFLFFINFSFFIFLGLKQFSLAAGSGNLILYLKILGFVFGLYFLKHFVLALIALIFPVWEPSALYSFTIVLFAIIAGVLFLPANILIAYTAAGVAKIFLISALTLFLLLILFRSLRGVFIGSDFLTYHKFHFLLYICTVEIAPALIMIKFFQNQLGV